jgi:hypothetical chaperone protein
MLAAIDFGTSNSAVCVTAARGTPTLVPLEPKRDTIPTAIFYDSESRQAAFGRAAVEQYEDGNDGRLLRSLKSLLGSALVNETTEIYNEATPYRKVIAHFLQHLKAKAEHFVDEPITSVVLGRPVHFVDDKPDRDALAQATLADIARDAGFRDVAFQFEPIAAALDYEQRLQRETLVLVIDIGGGTSDFSVIRLGPKRALAIDRGSDVLASAGLHVAGTDFDQRLSLATAMRALGLGAAGKNGKPVPVSLYYELATWHKINFLYTREEMALAEALQHFIEDRATHTRLMNALRHREGHRIAGAVEGAKIAVADAGETMLDLQFLEMSAYAPALTIPVTHAQLCDALATQIAQIVSAALVAVQRADLKPSDINTLYFTGGSTGVKALRDAFALAFPQSEMAQGDKFASVVRGLGITAAKMHAQR